MIFKDVVSGKTIQVALALGLTAFGAVAHAQNCPAPNNSNLFNVTLCVDGQVATVGSNTIMGMVDQIDEKSLKSQFTNYNELISAGDFRLDVRGLPVTLSYNRSSTVLNFSVPTLGLAETFNGGTRDASNELFKDYLKTNGSAILRELLKVSAVDPLAGNPASVQSAMVGTAFDAGMSRTFNGNSTGSAFSLGARFGRYSTGQFTQDVYNLPISYSYTFANHDRLIVDAPITYMQVQGASSYRLNLGLSYNKSIFAIWSLTPSFGYGLTGSTDLGAAGHIISASLTSDLRLYEGGGYRLSMGNMVGYYVTLPVRVGEYSVNYDIKNTITRNGLLLSKFLPGTLWGRTFSVDVFVTDTRFFGDALYSDNYQEYGISIGPARSADKLRPNASSHPFGLGIKYVRADKGISGFEMNFVYTF